jgi:flagellar protein FlbD
MVQVTRLNGTTIIINPDHIELIEARPDTVLKLTTGTSLPVRESAEEVVNRIVAYRQRILTDCTRLHSVFPLETDIVRGETP